MWSNESVRVGEWGFAVPHSEATGVKQTPVIPVLPSPWLLAAGCWLLAGSGDRRKQSRQTDEQQQPVCLVHTITTTTIP